MSFILLTINVHTIIDKISVVKSGKKYINSLMFETNLHYLDKVPLHDTAACNVCKTRSYILNMKPCYLELCTQYHRLDVDSTLCLSLCPAKIERATFRNGEIMYCQLSLPPKN